MIFLLSPESVWSSEGEKFFFNFILNYANSQLKFKIQASRFWRITSSFSRLQLKYWPKFDQLTHCYTLSTVPDVGDTGKNEGKRKEVEVTPVSIAHDVRKWLSDNAVSVAVFAKEVINLSQGTLSSLLNGQKKPNDDAGTSHSETSKKRKVFQKVETSCIAVHCAVLKDSNGLPSASMTERLAESMDLTKRQVIKMIKFSPFGLDIFTLFSSSSIHPAFIWWVFSPVWVTKRLENNFWILTSLDKPHT